MAINLGQRKGVIGEMNVVPLIDILLVLIIIFMATSPVASRGLQAQVPQPLPPGKKFLPPGGTVIIQVLSSDHVKINQEDATWEDLGPRLQAVFKQRAEKGAFVRGDADVSFALVAQAIDMMRSSGIENIGLISSNLAASQQ
jgi:biopolymer transport protein TolR